MNIESRVKKFDKQADMYDKKRTKLEFGPYRKQLLRSVRGRVLELGVGAGANFPFYGRGLELTAVDFSPVMLEKARAANEQLYGLNVDFIQSDVDRLAIPDDSYDTIVSTLTLCAYEQPDKVLERLSSWCKPDGQILLMEHGLSANRAIAFAQRKLNPIGCKVTGCHHNRDILELVSRAKLKVIRAERHYAGMLHLLWCGPYKG